MLYKIWNGSISYGGKTILEEINFGISSTDKIALVGRNGAGKTSLLNALVHNELLEEGIGDTSFLIEKKKQLKIGYLEQVSLKNEENTLLEELFTVFASLRKMEQRMHLLEAHFDEEDCLVEYETLRYQYQLQGGYEYLKEIHLLLKQFGFSLEDQEKKIKEFSGGWRTKIAMMKLLLEKPDLLLLDEPTNHLDLKTILWLEEYLKNYPKAIVLVSHDRMFLDQVVNKVYDLWGGSLVEYKGNYSSFEQQKMAQYETQKKDYERQQKEILRLQQIADRFRYKPTKAKMALSKLKKIEQMDLVEKPQELFQKSVRWQIQGLEESEDLVLECKHVEFGYDFPLGCVSFQLHKKERLAILGENGSGKSTLLKTIVGQIKKLDGKIKIGAHVSIGYFDQQFCFESEEKTVLEDFSMLFQEESKETLRKKLGAFFFSQEDVFKPIRLLSGGEKVRLELAKIFYQKPNFLILDEPTNHLDLQFKEVLEHFLLHYEGTVLFVSHDRYFINKIANSFLVLENQEARYFRGTYFEYQERKKVQVQDKPVVEMKKRVPKQSSLLQEKTKNIKKLEQEIKKLEVLHDDLTQAMLLEENYMDYQKMRNLEQQKKEVFDQIEKKMTEWEEESCILENLKG